MANLSIAVLIAGVVVAAFADVRTRRIPNALTGTLAALAIAVNVPAGWASVATAIAVMAIAFAFGTIAFSLGWFGGGDVKLLAACCGLAGFPGAASLVFYTFLAGGIVAVVEALRAGRLRTVFASTLRIATHRLSPAATTTVPYGVAIAIGTCVYVLSISAFPALRFPL